MFVITASELPRFMACNGSRLLGGITHLVEDNSLREEGIAAHWLCEQEFNGVCSAEELIDRKAPNGVYITNEMVEFTKDYRNAIRFNGTVEQNTSYAGDGWEVKGRADHIAIKEKTLHVSDLKYGWRLIEPENNWVLISHAVGWLSSNPSTEVDEIVFTIYQPRPFHPNGNIRSWAIKKEQLTQLTLFLHQTLGSPSDLLFTGEHCRNCPSVSQCPAMQKALMNAIDSSENAFNSEINNEVLSLMLTETKKALDVLEENYKAYSELALQRCRNGEIVHGYSVQSAIGQTTWKTNVTAEFLKMLTGLDLRKEVLVTPAQAKKQGVPSDIIESLVERPNKGFKLVKVDDAKRAKQLFQKERN